MSAHYQNMIDAGLNTVHEKKQERVALQERKETSFLQVAASYWITWENIIKTCILQISFYKRLQILGYK